MSPVQLEFFPSYYMSQADAARSLGISVRLIQYWEAAGLLHPELAQSGRNRRYSPRDVQELSFIKAHLVDMGYSLPSLKRMLSKLAAPYAYDPNQLYWHPGRQCWTCDVQTAWQLFGTRWPDLASLLVGNLEGSAKGSVNEIVETTRQVLAQWLRDTVQVAPALPLEGMAQASGGGFLEGQLASKDKSRSRRKNESFKETPAPKSGPPPRQQAALFD